jgi:elongation factor G
MPRETTRNIGISAHIDAGKTTLTERILYYTHRIHATHEVKGKDGVGATMDSMDLERERGLTIQSAATHCQWREATINIIDTPGHVDFTIEVERALRVLDGAVLVLCAVAGVQSQTITVDRQMRRYGVPRVVFVNKCDRTGASPLRVARQLEARLGLAAVPVQIPIGVEADLAGVVDLVEMRALYFDGDHGQRVRAEPVPATLMPEALHAREELLDTASMFSDELTEAVLEDRVTPGLVRAALRAGTLSGELTPVLMGSAYKNKGVQPLLDAVVDYLPGPPDARHTYIDLESDETRAVEPIAEAPTLALVFKIEESRHGQLAYLRLYQGEVTRGDLLHDHRSGAKIKVGRLVRMHADQMEEIKHAVAGDIVVLFGADCASGDTLTSGDLRASMSPMHVPDPVIGLTVTPRDSTSQMAMSKALHRFTREDPTFRCEVDPESGETVISGMGELHLEVYVERMKREHGVEVDTSPPRVAYRETITQRAAFSYTHKKQTGGAGQYGRIDGHVEPASCTGMEFEDRVRGGSVPTEFIPSVEKGFRSMMAKGPLIECPVTGLRVVLEDGNSHSVDSSDLAFQAAARGAFLQVYHRAKPQILEPVMRVAVETPNEFQGAVLRTLIQRRGMIVGTNEDAGFSVVEAEVPLATMFGYSTDLRSATQGKAEFTMEFARYAPVPASIAEELVRLHATRRREVGR